MSIPGEYATALFDQDNLHAASASSPSFAPSRQAPPRGPRPRPTEPDVPLQTNDKPPVGAAPPQSERSRSDYKQPDTYLSPEVDRILSLFKNKSKSGFEQLLGLELTQVQNYADILDASLDKRTLQDKTRTQQLKGLQRLCGTFGVLPSSFILTDTFDEHGLTPFATGGFSRVCKTTFKKRPVAVKYLVVNTSGKESLQKMRRLLAREVVGWKWLRHENILPFVGVTPGLAIVSDLMEHGNIIEFIANHPRHNRLHLLMGTATGLEYLHRRGIVHGDLKGANILIDSGYSARLADFGLAMIIDESTVKSTTGGHEIRGTTRWMAPEMLLPEEYGFSGVRLRQLPSTSTDIYALGMSILEVLTGRRPFDDIKKEATVMLKVMVGEKPSRPPSAFSDALWNHLLAVWDAEHALQSSKRPPIQTILNQLREDMDNWEQFIVLPSPERGDESWLSRSSEWVGYDEVLVDTTVTPEAAPSTGQAPGPRPGSKAEPFTLTTTGGDQPPFEVPPKPAHPAWRIIRGRSRKGKDKEHHPSPLEPEPLSPSPSLIVLVGEDIEQDNEKGFVAVGNPVIDGIRGSVGTVGGIVRALAQKMGANTSRERSVSGEFKGFISKPNRITYNPYEQPKLYNPSKFSPHNISPPYNPPSPSRFSLYNPSDPSTFPVPTSDSQDYYQDVRYSTNTFYTGTFRGVSEV